MATHQLVRKRVPQIDLLKGPREGREVQTTLREQTRAHLDVQLGEGRGAGGLERTWEGVKGAKGLRSFVGCEREI